MRLFDMFTGTKRPAVGTLALPKEEVKRRLLALNRPTAPWQVTDGATDGVDLVAEWRLNEDSYKDAFHQSKKETVFRILMKLDEVAHEVRASDREYQASWGVDGFKLSASVSGFRGQKQTVSFGGPTFFTERLPSGETIAYHFATREIKKPLQDAVTSSGWTYKGVAFGKL